MGEGYVCDVYFLFFMCEIVFVIDVNMFFKLCLFFWEELIVVFGVRNIFEFLDKFSVD